MSRPTKSKPLDDRGMWKQILAKTHPDAGGSHEAFLFAQALQEHVLAGGGPVGDQNRQARAQPEPQPRSQQPRRGSPDAVPFDPDNSFEAVMFCAFTAARDVPELYARLLLLLEGCEEAYSGPLADQQRRGASYRQLAAIGHAVGMPKAQRVEWYRIAESIPLSMRCAGHILSRLKGRAA